MARLLAVLLLVVSAAPVGAEGGDPAVTALRRDDSLKVRTQAAIVLGQRGTPEAIAALREAVAGDQAPSVRLAAVAALGRLMARGARLTLQAASQADPEEAVRAAAVRALGALGPVTLTVEEAGGPFGPRLSAAVSAQLRERGLTVADHGELKVRPKLVAAASEAGGRTTFEARASLAVIDGDGRIDLLETQARAAVNGVVTEARRGTYLQKVVDAAGKELGDDLANKVGRR